VLVTANVNRGGMGGNNENNEDVSDGLQDKLIIIDPITDTIVDSVQLGIDLHLAHVVADKAGDTAYVNAQETGEVFVVDINKKTLISKFDLGEGTGPHGLRLAPDDTKLFIALVDGQAIASVDLTTKVISKYPLNGKAVQTAVTASGEYVFASVYDTKKVAWVNVQNGGQGYIDLPEDAQGPIQLYATPDSKYLYVVNQGHYFGQPVARSVHRIDIEKKMVDNTIVVGDAPHGIVVDKSGDFAYVTNLLSDDLSIVDTSTNKEVARLKVGKMPNGISIWNKTLGGTQ
jgi:YVTN family beta-propeller protein